MFDMDWRSSWVHGRIILRSCSRIVKWRFSHFSHILESFLTSLFQCQGSLLQKLRMDTELCPNCPRVPMSKSKRQCFEIAGTQKGYKRCGHKNGAIQMEMQTCLHKSRSFSVRSLGPFFKVCKFTRDGAGVCYTSAIIRFLQDLHGCFCLQRFRSGNFGAVAVPQALRMTTIVR